MSWWRKIRDSRPFSLPFEQPAARRRAARRARGPPPRRRRRFRELTGRRSRAGRSSARRPGLDPLGGPALGPRAEALGQGPLGRASRRARPGRSPRSRNRRWALRSWSRSVAAASGPCSVTCGSSMPCPRVETSTPLTQRSPASRATTCSAGSPVAGGEPLRPPPGGGGDDLDHRVLRGDARDRHVEGARVLAQRELVEVAERAGVERRDRRDGHLERRLARLAQRSRASSRAGRPRPRPPRPRSRDATRRSARAARGRRAGAEHARDRREGIVRRRCPRRPARSPPARRACAAGARPSPGTAAARRARRPPGSSPSVAPLLAGPRDGGRQIARGAVGHGLGLGDEDRARGVQAVREVEPPPARPAPPRRRPPRRRARGASRGCPSAAARWWPPARSVRSRVRSRTRLSPESASPLRGQTGPKLTASPTTWCQRAWASTNSGAGAAPAARTITRSPLGALPSAATSTSSAG